MSKRKTLEKKVLELIQKAITTDVQLREKYQIANKFRFVQDRLQKILEKLENNLLLEEESQSKESARVKQDDEMVVFVYLFNAHGLNLTSWQKMLIPRVFYEYSINRPIYISKTHVELLLKSKSNKAHHGYLTIAVKANDIIQALEDASLKDAMGNPLVKVKEGSLHIKNVIAFTFNGHDYEVNERGELLKKDI